MPGQLDEDIYRRETFVNKLTDLSHPLPYTCY